jgi:hypothetical protein
MSLVSHNTFPHDAKHTFRLSQVVDAEHACHKIDKRISPSSSSRSHHAIICVKDGHDMSTTVHDPQCRIRITLHQAMGCKFSIMQMLRYEQTGANVSSKSTPC